MKTVIFILRQKKVKTPVVILIVIWETETNPHSNVHKPPHVLPMSNEHKLAMAPKRLISENREFSENASDSEPQLSNRGSTRITPGDELPDVLMDGNMSSNK
ncbi:hypothetical protein E2C01_001855 [Portunus trituberculatus]|uniref:Uncharacterized protein n=1 Tax=Portunus trituberculatus TaxID=210409 RepID=A0A5B7CNK9_PORTR|nr:hypothetical protein [Portunus trituberculatus]